MLAKRFAKLFLEHPSAVGETYGEHLRHAMRIGASLIAAGGACFIHALFPGLCVSTASNKIRSLTVEIDKRLETMPASDTAVANPAGDYPVTLLMSEKLTMSEKHPH